MDREPLESEPWRERVLRRMLTVAALVAPSVVALTLFARASARNAADTLVFGAVGVLLPVLRLARGLPIRLRGLAAIAIIFGTSVYGLGRIGFGAGAVVALYASSVLGVIYLGRGVGFLFIGLTGFSVVTVGWLVTSRTITLQAVDVDPHILRNWLRMAGTTTLLTGLLALVIDFVIRQVEAGARASAEALLKLRLAYQRLGRLHSRLDAAKERERGSLSHELRDELGQSLTALKLHLQLKVPAAPGFGDTVALVDRLISQVRRMSGDLRPPLLDEIGLVPALRAYLENQAALFGLEIDLQADVPNDAEQLSPDLEITCFRVVQESLTNALRHASARQIRVRLRRDEARLSLSVSDDGRGFDTATLDEAAAAGHVGVVGMRERVRARGGIFRLASRPDHGTVTEVAIPLAPPSDRGAEDELRRSVPAERASGLTAIGSWRDDVRNGMLSVVAVFAPLLVILALLVGPPRALGDIVVLTAAGLSLPLLRLLATPSTAARATTAIALLFVVAIYLLARAGFGTGVSVVLVATSVIAVVCLRAFGFALLGITGLAYVAIGFLAAKGRLRFDPAEVDPMSLFIWLRLAATLVLLGAMAALVIDFVIRHVETSAEAITSALKELRLAYRRLGLLHHRLDAAKEEERRFLAHELHDELSQTLTAIKIRLQLTAGQATRGGGSATAAPRETIDLINDLNARVRKISSDLRPPLLDEVGLFPALRAYTEGQAAASGLAIDLTTENASAIERLPPDIEIACFRIVQESIANTLRHARASRLSIHTVQQTDRLSLSIRDDGAGFDPATLDDDPDQEQLGILGMRERVRALAGAFHLDSRLGAGTTIQVELPLNDQG